MVRLRRVDLRRLPRFIVLKPASSTKGPADHPGHKARIRYHPGHESHIINHSGHEDPIQNRRRPYGDDGGSSWKDKLLEGAATAFGSVMVLGLIGFAYDQSYKWLILHKMDKAFAVGYSTPERAALLRHVSSGPDNEVIEEGWISRSEQPLIDRIVDGSNQGFYYLITGEKGTGKTSMILNAMRRIHGDGIAMMEASGDLEVFRLRLGKALWFEFHEDYIGGLFSYRGPRNATPLLDIERSFNKLEKIALKRRTRKGKPLLLIINRAHLMHDDEEGNLLLEAIQQRAETWAASKLVTIIFISDEYWIEERLRPIATRMRVLPIHDLAPGPVMSALRDFRASKFQEQVPADTLTRIYNKIGGRLSFLSQVANAKDMEKACDELVRKEKRWFLDQCWILGRDIDDHAEDHQDFAAAAMLLAKALVAKENEMVQDAATAAAREGATDPASASDAASTSSLEPAAHVLPAIPLHKVRELMTRHDFIKQHDHLNIFSIDSECMVRADSMAMQNVFREVVAQEGFEAHLADTLERLDELESLGRTRELTWKDIKDGDVVRAVVTEQGEGGRRSKVVNLKVIASGDGEKPRE